MKTTLNQESEFPHLNIGHLKRHAKRWTDLFSDVPITKIRLFHKFNKLDADILQSKWYKERSKEEKANIRACRYIIFFDVDFIDEDTDRVLQPGHALKQVRNTEKKHPFYKFKLAVENYNSSPDILNNVFIGPGFKDVYENEPQEQSFLRDWRFIALALYSPMPLYVETKWPSVILFEINKPVERALSFEAEQKDRFDNLNLVKLSDLAFEWCQRFYFIDKILLYRVKGKKVLPETKYIIAFNVGELFKRWDGQTKRSFLNWQELSTIDDESILAELCEVYSGSERVTPEDAREWTTVILEHGDSLDEIVLAGSDVVLAWRSGVNHKRFKNAFDAIIKDALLEIIPLWEEITRGGLCISEIDIEKKRQRRALDFFDAKGYDYKLLKSDYLNDLDLFCISDSNARRDFIGKLLQVIINNKTNKKIGVTVLYEKAKRLEKSSLELF